MRYCEIVCKDFYDFLMRHAPVQATVHSVYHHVVNLTVAGRIITLCQTEDKLTPWGMVCAQLKPHQYQLQSTLIIGTCTLQQPDIYMDAAAVRIQDMTLGLEPLQTGSSTVVSALGKMVAQFCRQHMPEGSIGEILPQVADWYPPMPPGGDSVVSRAAVPLLKAFLSALQLGDSMQGAPNIIGLGVGLTPSADDFLLGMLSVFHFWRSPREQGLKEYIANQLGATTQISAGMLQNALEDRYPLYMLKLYQTLSQHSDKTSTILPVFLEHGHSSGIDTLHGIYVGLHMLEADTLTKRT